eukprot:Blabericola_migrator_1__7051@NODE_3578_length_1664_cov_247_534126_g2222_i0_p3_GENE_NODE_3578_length_1664_cov_247_534126_g2222_i0NODE_3578_length_1664_cov_247_534126_g2222_i0_p3_ORF_typecomplete_len104_score1_20_NODE_3578_length_1664_cov_247_534126_g2222_i012721583
MDRVRSALTKTCAPSVTAQVSAAIAINFHSFPHPSDTCVENSLIGDTQCVHRKGWISSKRHCDGYLTWWIILLIVLGCVCLCPLISFLCFVYVIKKICCGGGE